MKNAAGQIFYEKNALQARPIEQKISRRPDLLT